MRYYKLINGKGHRVYKEGTIYKEDYLHPSLNAPTNKVSCWVQEEPHKWQLCEEYEYYLQEGLPERWVVATEGECLPKELYEWRYKIYWSNSPGYIASNKTWFGGIPRNYTEISFDTFKRLVLKQNDMKDREIIGYKLKDDCKQYRGAAEKIADYESCSTPLEFYLEKSQWGSFKQNLEKAGVLNLWFDAIYAEEYKVGDWVVVVKPCRTSINKKGLVGTITDIDKDGNLIDFGHCVCYEVAGGNWEHISGLRKATPEEVKASQQKELYFGKVKFTIKRGDDFASTEYGNISKSDIKKAIDYIENPPKLKGYTLSVATLTGSEERFDSLDGTYLTYTFGCTKGKLQELKDIYNAFE